MAVCELYSIMTRLRKSSSESIDNVDEFDDFKEYMHVVRRPEDDLKFILRKVNESGIKTLVLLCGSAGDGKSHLLSYLKNNDDEKLIDDYYIYNDATESSLPDKTAIQTLVERLKDFNDDRIDKAGKNVILAINLGVLSNFIEMDENDSFSKLKEYVQNSNILGTKVDDVIYENGSSFQNVSFSDYHVYSLTENGVHAEYVEQLLNKVFDNNDNNIFYKTYLNVCEGCPYKNTCPLKCNYEYLMNDECRTNISNLIAKTSICDKMVLTTREILNCIYDVVVPKDFSSQAIHASIDKNNAIKRFVDQTTPMLLYGSENVTQILNILRRYDPLRFRSERGDEDAIAYFVSTNVGDNLKNALHNTPYYKVICSNESLSTIQNDNTLKSVLFKMIERISFISGDYSTGNDKIYDLYTKNLFYFNSGQGDKLADLYGLVEKAFRQWCGSDEDGNVCLDDRIDGYKLYEEVELRPSIDHLPTARIDSELHRFMPFLKVVFKDPVCDGIELDIDYSLYILLHKLSKGYIQTANDRNNHADFISFVRNALRTGSLNNKIYVCSESGIKAKLLNDTFGFKYKVV